MAAFRWFALVLFVWGCSGEPPVGEAKGNLEAPGAPWQFGGVLVGDQETAKFVLQNTGRVPVTAWVESLPEAFHFAPDAGNPLVVPPSGSIEVEGRFSPLEVGPVSGSVVWKTTGTLEERLVVRISGEGLSREVQVPATLDFGIVPVGQTRTMELPIRSMTGKPADVIGKLTGELTAFSPGDFSITLEPGAEENVAIRFHPQTVGSHSARYVVETCKGCEKTVTLRGQGGAERLHGRPQMVPFGVISPGMVAGRELQLENRGYLDVPVKKAIFVEGSDPAFRLEDPSQVVTVVPQDGFRSLQLLFEPGADTERGEKRGSLRFLGENDEWLVDVPLVGVVGGPDTLIEPRAVGFGVLPVGVEARRRVRIVNEGNLAPLKILEVGLVGTDAGRFDRTVLPGTHVVIGEQPGVIELTYRSTDPGIHSATLVVRTDDDDTAEVEIPLFGETRALGSCELVVAPGEVRFGLVGVDAFRERTVRIHNAGPDTCAVWNFEFDDPAGAFAVDGMPTGSHLLGPGASLDLAVSMDTTTPGPQGIAHVRFAHSREGEVGVVRVSGQVAALDLEIVPPLIDFGRMARGSANASMLSLVNKGASVEVTRFGFAAGGGSFDVEALEIPGGLQGIVTPPGRIDNGARGILVVQSAANDPGKAYGELELHLRGQTSPIIVPVLMEVAELPCGESCSPPEALCQPGETVRVNRPTPVVGVGLAGTEGGSASCSWALIGKPDRSRSEVVGTGCATVLTPDRPGEYLLQLNVDLGAGVTRSCMSRVVSTPPRGIWLEAIWQFESDVDLRLLHPSAGDPRQPSSWFSSSWMCGFSWCSHSPLEWDEPGPVGNPFLERWDTVGTGPEQISLELPVPGHRYAVGLRWFQARGVSSNLVTTRVYCDGVEKAAVSTNLTRQGESVFVGTVEYQGASGCIWTPDGTRM